MISAQSFRDAKTGDVFRLCLCGTYIKAYLFNPHYILTGGVRQHSYSAIHFRLINDYEKLYDPKRDVTETVTANTFFLQCSYFEISKRLRFVSIVQFVHRNVGRGRVRTRRESRTTLSARSSAIFLRRGGRGHGKQEINGKKSPQASIPLNSAWLDRSNVYFRTIRLKHWVF